MQASRPEEKSLEQETELIGHRHEPLSFHQECVWSVDAFEKKRVNTGSPGYYNIPVIIHLSGALDLSLLEQVINSVIMRHEALRTRIRNIDGQIFQEILASHRIFVRKFQATGASLDQQIADAIVATREPFIVDQSPAVRAEFFSISESEGILVLVLHHLIADVASICLLVRELAETMETLRQTPAVSRPGVLFQYADYAKWQRAITDEMWEPFLFYWKQQLADLQPLELPCQRSRPAVLVFNEAWHQRDFQPFLGQRLESLARVRGAELYFVLLAVFEVILHRYTGQDEIVLGTSETCRDQEGTQDLIGPVANLVVIRNNLSGNPTFADLLTRVRQALIQAKEYSEIPFGKLVMLLNQEKNMSRNPLFDVLFRFEEYPLKKFRAAGVTGTVIETNLGYGKYDLSVLVQKDATGLVCHITYNAYLFEPWFIEQMVCHFEKAIKTLAGDVTMRIDDFCLLAPEEIDHQRRCWNATSTSFAAGGVLLHQLIEAQAARTPDVPAVSDQLETLTFAQLNSRANQLARYLRNTGVGSETLVGVFAERSVSLVVALLGILKSGAAYLPLDPDYPLARLGFMIEDANPMLLLTQEHLLQRLPSTAVQSINLDRKWSCIAEESGENSASLGTPSTLAYVIYTSGSTGKPKGAGNTHSGIVNRLLWMQQEYRLDSTDKVLQKTPFSFDVSVWELFWPLLCGVELVMARPGGHKDPFYLSEVIGQRRITTIHFVPSMLSAFLEHGDLSACGSLRRIICSGEELPVDLQKRCLESLPVELHNLYGPTEAAVDVTYWKCRLEPNRNSVPIGRPIANTQIYILDAGLKLVPVGIAGELYIGGAGLARGYWRRPDLTAEKFVPNPFGGQGDRLYRTGDKAAFSPDGVIEFMGRVDHQIKIRGFRIELGEIESELRSHAKVKDAVVIVEDEGGAKRLVAYVLAQQGEFTEGELREYLKERLPEYMVPGVYVRMESLPLTVSGKVDRKRLPKADRTAAVRRQYVGPRTPVEEQLVEIWKQVLKVERVGIHDNFFELGGDSILSMQIVSRANEAGLKLTVKQLFTHPTVVELAVVAAQQMGRVQAEQGLVVGPVELTPIQRWFFEQEREAAHHYNQSTLLQVSADVQVGWVEHVVEGLVKHHDALRMRFQRTEQGWEQESGTEVRGIFEKLDLSSEADVIGAMERRVNQAQASLNLEQGPLVRAVWMELGSQGRRLLLVVHHLVVDAVSWRILLEDLERGCRQLAGGQALNLPAKSSSYQQWAGRLKAYGQSADALRELEYWRMVAGRQGELPGESGTGENREGNAKQFMMSLSVEQTRELQRRAMEKYRMPLQEVLLAALALAAQKSYGVEQLKVEMEGHGREEWFEDLDVTRTVGWFTSLYPVILGWKGEWELAEGLKRVKEQVRGVPRRGMGYGILKYLGSEKLAEERAQIVFNYLGQLDGMTEKESWFQFTRENRGVEQSAQSLRAHEIEIGGGIMGGQLGIWIRYSPLLQEQVEKFGSEWLRSLQRIVEHCGDATAGGYTPSDFPLARLKQEEINQIEQAYGAEKIEDIYLLTPMQEGMIFHSLYAPDSGVYLQQVSCCFGGRLNVKAFKAAWQAMMEKHSILRTGFARMGLDRPHQIVYRPMALNWDEQDWRGYGREEQHERLESYLAADRRKGFDHSQAPLMRFALYQLAEGEYQFVWSYHHVLLDGWCVPLLINDVSLSYGKFVRGEKLEISRVPPYRNYIGWLQEQDLGKAEVFWRERLKGFKEPTSFGVDRSSTTIGAICQETKRFSRESSLRLQEMGREQQLTANTIVQGAWAMLLSRYSGSDDVVFGTTVSGRPPEVAGMENMLGLFINTLPVRVRVRGEVSIVEWLKQMQKEQVEMREYEYSPLVQIHGWSEVTRGRPLFESLQIFENYPVADSLQETHPQAGEDLSINIQNVRFLEQINYPLGLTCSMGSELLLQISYDSNRFPPSTVGRMLMHLESLLDGMVKNPGGLVSGLEILSAEEREQLLVSWNKTEREFPDGKCIHDLFEEQVERTPEAVAVVYGVKQVTYRELNKRSNHLARCLRSLGVGPEVLVGICAERGVEMVIGLLGILKAGGAYVPLDPTHPQERRMFVLQDSAMSVLLASQSFSPELLESLPEGNITSVVENLAVLNLKAGLPILNESSGHGRRKNLPSECLAYVLYTSGSTGRPKGVQVPHQAVVNFLTSMSREPGLTATDSLLAITTLSFDIAGLELWLPLVVGARVIIADREVTMNGEELADLLSESSASVMQATPATCRMLLATGWMGTPGLKVLCGGEAWDEQMARELFGRSASVWNMYGPTETTIWSAAVRVAGSESPVIGGLVANTQFYILDRELQPVPIGLSGELHIAGAGLARGYLNRPELTAEKFIANPFAQKPGSRLYKTGDLVRYRPDGRIDFLGRIDHQVKIRGFRIELWEIEAALGSHAAVREVAVVVRHLADPKAGSPATLADPTLVAYYTCADGAAPQNFELRQHLKQKLPDYMIPAAFVRLESLPLMPNGKLDRNALPVPDSAHYSVSVPFIAPRTPLEESLARMWGELLGVKRVGIHDNFFELGGHSLLITQLAVRLSQELHVEIPLRILFDNPTIERMSIAIAEQLAAQLDPKETEQILSEIKGLSPEEIDALLRADANE